MVRLFMISPGVFHSFYSAGTLFNQQYFICDWWFNVDCSQVNIIIIISKCIILLLRLFSFSQAQDFYSLNADIAAAAAAANDDREGRTLDVSDITDIKNLDGPRRKISG